MKQKQFPAENETTVYKHTCKCPAKFRAVKMVGTHETVFCSHCIEIISTKRLTKEDFELSKTDIFLNPDGTPPGQAANLPNKKRKKSL